MRSLIRTLIVLGCAVAYGIAGQAGVALAQTPPARPYGGIGITAEAVTADIAAQKKLAVPFGALVIAVEPMGVAVKSDLQAGDVIISLDGQPITDARTLDARLTAAPVGSDIAIGRMRGGQAATVRIKILAPPLPRPSPRVASGGPGSERQIAPRLMIDTGGHTSIVKGLVWTPDGRQIVSAGDDKVIRVWDAASGKTVRTIRGEIEPGAYGQIFALALSADARWLAVAGFMAPGQGVRNDEVGAIRIHDFATGELVALLSDPKLGHSNVVNRLAFTPDGRRLVSGQGGQKAFAVVWEAGANADGGWRAGGRPVHQLTGHALQIYGLAITPDGRRVVTGSYDKTLRLWDIETGRQIGEPMTGHSERITAVGVTPWDGSIVSGSDDGEIRIWDGQTGKYQRTLANQKTSIGVFSFSGDGQQVLASCAQRCPEGHAYVYDFASGRDLFHYRGHDNIVLAGAISPDGKWAATAGGNKREIHIWDVKTGKPRSPVNGQTLAFSGTGSAVWGVGFSADGSHVGWGNVFESSNPFARGPIGFRLRLPIAGAALGRPEAVADSAPLAIQPAPTRQAVGDNTEKLARPRQVPSATAPTAAQPSAPASATTWVRALQSRGTTSLSHRQGGVFDYADAILDIRRGDKVVSITRQTWDGYQNRAYTLTPDGTTVVSGGANGIIVAYDLDGRAVAEFVGHDSDIWAIAPSADGRYLVTGAADQTVRIWNLTALKDADVKPVKADVTLPSKKILPIVTLFHGRDGEWAMWTEEGYYMGSPGAGRIVGWQLSNGTRSASDYFSGTQVRDRLLRPDIVETAIRLGSSKAAIKQAGREGVSIETLLRNRPPTIRVDGGDKNIKAFGGRAIIMVIAEPSPAPITDVAASVTGLHGEARVTARAVPLPAGVAADRSDGSTTMAFEVPLFGGGNIVRFVAQSENGESQPAVVGVDHSGEGALDRRGTLWIVAVGVNDYPKAKIMYPDLRFAVKDAETFANVAETSMRTGHATVDSTVLVNGRGADREPTRANIVKALARVLKEARDTDTVVVFLAGHGENWEGGRYHFLPTDLERSLKTDIGRNVLDWGQDIQFVLARAKGRKLLFLDACHSGNAYNQTLLAGADADRFVAFAAAGPEQDAVEFSEEGHGAFTYSVMQGLKGDAQAIDPLENAVTVYRLGDFLSVEVRRRTQGAQAPEYRSGLGNFVLSRK